MRATTAARTSSQRGARGQLSVDRCGRVTVRWRQTSRMGTPACHQGSEVGHVSDPFPSPTGLGRWARRCGADVGADQGEGALGQRLRLGIGVDQHQVLAGPEHREQVVGRDVERDRRRVLQRLRLLGAWTISDRPAAGPRGPRRRRDRARCPTGRPSTRTLSPAAKRSVRAASATWPVAGSIARAERWSSRRRPRRRPTAKPRAGRSSPSPPRTPTTTAMPDDQQRWPRSSRRSAARAARGRAAGHPPGRRAIVRPPAGGAVVASASDRPRARRGAHLHRNCTGSRSR